LRTAIITNTKTENEIGLILGTSTLSDIMGNNIKAKITRTTAMKIFVLANKKRRSPDEISLYLLTKAAVSAIICAPVKQEIVDTIRAATKKMFFFLELKVNITVRIVMLTPPIAMRKFPYCSDNFE
jgi:3-oxoacyl-[acyl-carrier-protein] synthase III